MTYLQGLFDTKRSIWRPGTLFWVAALLLCALSAGAQDDLNIHGVVSDALSSSKLNGVEVVVKMDGARHDAFTTRANGKYEFYLDVGHSYTLEFSKDGYVTRSIVINSQGVPPEVVGAGIIMPTDMSMYALTDAMKDADLSVFDKPIGKAAYDPAQADLVWDFAYTGTVKGQIESLMRDMDKKQKELDKEADAAEKQAEEREEQFKDLVDKGDEAMGRDRYEDAVLNYQAALKIKPDEAPVKAKLDDAQAKWDAQKATEKLEADYTAALDAGDGFMRTEEYDKAIEQYQVASAIKPDETYPKDQIAEATRIKEERAANQAKQSQFNDLMAEADKHFDDREYQAAIDKYDAALGVIPGNVEAEGKREKAADALKAQQEAEKNRADYEAAIAEADALFGDEKYDEALPIYQSAAALMPDEAYAAQQIEACETKIEQQAEAAEKQEEFDGLMAAGNQALGKTEYEEAVINFEQALGVLPNEPEAKTKLEEAQKLLDELQAEQETQAAYDAAIQEADKSFDKDALQAARDKYTEAKELMPGEEYPTQRIAEVDRLLAERADAEAAKQNYDAAMTAAAAAVDAEKYQEAVDQYDKALAAMPDDGAATQGKEAAQTALQAQLDAMESRAAYDAKIAEADKLLQSEELENSREAYQAALDMMPDEAYPASQLAVVDDMIAKRDEAEELQAQFDGLVDKGDQAVAKANYREAITAYAGALELMESPEVEDKRNAAQAALDEMEAAQDLDEKYSAAVAQADQYFDDQALDEALAEYQRAAELKPDETYPPQRIATVRERLAANAAAEAEAEKQRTLDRVTALVGEGDLASDQKKYGEAIDKYTEALELLPERQDVADKLAQAEKDLLASQEQAAVDEAYNDAVAGADKDFDKGNWQDAMAAYREALEIKPDEKYPQERIDLAQEELDRMAKEEQFAREAELKEQFDELLSDGDRQMARNKFEKALDNYNEALALLPDNAVAQRKVDEAKRALDDLEASRADLTAYEAAIAEADELFDEESYETAKLKYLDAKELMPDREYPAKQITRIELLLEKQRLREENEAEAERRRAYEDAVYDGDAAMAAQEYDTAREAFEKAQEIEPNEPYPQSQIERLELLIKEREADERERKRLADLEKEREKAEPRERTDYNRVNADSEDQAEKFMREAREAQEKERYERIKKQKESHRENTAEYAAAAKDRREANLGAMKTFRSADDRFAEARAEQEDKVKNSQRYKKAILANTQKRAEMGRLATEENQKTIAEAKSRRKKNVNQREALHKEKTAETLELIEEQHEAARQRSQNSQEARRETRDELNAQTAERHVRSDRAEEKRREAAEDVRRKGQAHSELIAEMSAENQADIKARQAELDEFQDRRQAEQKAKNQDKVQGGDVRAREQLERYANAMDENRALAEQRREENYRKTQDLSTGAAKTPEDYHRSALAEDYPQGVTEESATMGNKVIITRVVVKGNRGDEYKKVVDQAGNYYFKNGQSISEHTWNRETIGAFNKSKD